MSHPNEITVDATIRFNNLDLHVALEWSRRNRYDYENDGSIGSLLFDAFKAGVIDGVIKEVISDHPSEGMRPI